jgi:hypothetical protein
MQLLLQLFNNKGPLFKIIDPMGDFRMSQTWLWQEEKDKWQLACLQLSAIDANLPGGRPK